MSFSNAAVLRINKGKVSGTNTDFPVPLILTDYSLRTVANGGKVQDANGYDIRPYSDLGLSAALSFELVFYDGATGQVFMFVKVASVASSADTYFYLGFGDAALNSNGSGTGTWNANALLVNHYGNGVTLNATDSTSNGLNGTVTTPTATSGQLPGGAANFNGTSDIISYGSPASLKFTNTATFSISMWMNDNVTQANVVSNPYAYASASAAPAWYIGRDYSSGVWANNCIYFEYYDGTSFISKNSLANTLSRGAWHHVVITKDATNSNPGILIFIDGVGQATSSRAGTGSPASINYTSLSFNVGSRVISAGQLFYKGFLQDFQVWNGILSPGWILTYFNATSSPSTFISATFGIGRPLMIGQAVKRASHY